jgi:cytochrome c oxidase subunit 1
MGTVWGGKVDLKTPMMFALGFIALFTIGGISGVMHSIAASDAQQQDTYFIVAHIHYVLFGGAIFAIQGGMYYWFPKITGHMYNEVMGHISFWLLFVGMNMAFFPMHFTGLDGMPRRIYTYDSMMGWSMWNGVSTLGAFLMALAFLVFIINFVRSWKNGPVASADPWDGRTLEWSIPSPPPEYNFATIPTVYERDAFWAQKRRQTHHGVPVGGGSGEEVTHDIHLPQPSYWPLVVSVGLLIFGFGLIYSVPVTVVGAFIGLVGVYAWSLEPVNDPEAGHDAH